MHKVISINAATKKVIETGGKQVETGIFKQALNGPANIELKGVESDTIVNTKVHGGPDQAIYLYSQADYFWWSEQLEEPLAPGTFGENITISAFPEQPLKIGDRLVINDCVELEITAPRVPCSKLAARMNDPKFGKKFVAAVRPGAYARVKQVGQIQSGDSVEWIQTEDDFALINDVFVEWHKKDWSRAVFEKAVRSPVSNIARRIIEERYLV